MSEPVRADITVQTGLEDCRVWRDSQFCNNANIENIKHFEWHALSEHSVPALSELLAATSKSPRNYARARTATAFLAEIILFVG